MAPVCFCDSAQFVKIPDAGAPEAQWTHALTRIQTILRGDKSLAFATDLIDTTPASNYVMDAMAQMTGNEILAYRSWRKGDANVPIWNPSQTMTSGLENASRKDWVNKAAALRVLYPSVDITTAQAKAWVLSNPGNPLFRAHLLIIKSKRHAAGGLADIDPRYSAEKRAVKKLLSKIDRHMRIVLGSTTCDVMKSKDPGFAHNTASKENNGPSNCAPVTENSTDSAGSNASKKKLFQLVECVMELAKHRLRALDAHIGAPNSSTN